MSWIKNEQNQLIKNNEILINEKNEFETIKKNLNDLLLDKNNQIILLKKEFLNEKNKILFEKNELIKNNKLLMDEINIKKEKYNNNRNK